MKVARIVGIDLGTSNSLIACSDKGKIRVLTDENGEALIPSAVSFDDSGKVLAVGQNAREKKLEGDPLTLFSTKRFMGKGSLDVRDWMTTSPFDFSKSDEKSIRFSVGGESCTPVDVASIILKKLRKIAEEHLGETNFKAVITVPAYFDDNQRQATRFAGELAGLEIVRILNEPTAACLAYGLDKKATGTVAVFDLGGGTFDISILRISEGLIEVLATNGDTALGGDDLDDAIFLELQEKVKKHFDIHDLSKDLMGRMKAEAERIKRELSEKQKASYRISFGAKVF